MKRVTKPHAIPLLLVLLGLVLLPLVPADAGNGNESKRNGGIDPTSVPLIDDDIDTATNVALEPTELTAGTGTILTPESDLVKVAVVEPDDDAQPAAHPTGKGILVAVVDSGFNLHHPELSGHVAAHGYDFVDGDGDPEDLGNGIDDDGDGLVDGGVGHGTFVAGQILKVAPEAMILPIRARNDEGLGTNESLVAAVEYAVTAGADVINLSVHPGETKMKQVTRTLDNAWSAGVLIVVAAGNSGWQWDLNELAWGTERVAVGAVNAKRQIAAFSNWYLDNSNDASMVFAPGVDVYGPIGTPHDEACATWSGTSFSAAIVSGAAALAREHHPDMGPDSIRKLLLYAVDPITTPEGKPVDDHEGCINLEKVMAR